MNPWIALGILLLGAGIGALLTALMYSAQFRRLKHSLRAGSEPNPHTEEQNRDAEDKQRKSA